MTPSLMQDTMRLRKPDPADGPKSRPCPRCGVRLPRGPEIVLQRFGLDEAAPPLFAPKDEETD